MKPYCKILPVLLLLLISYSSRAVDAERIIRESFPVTGKTQIEIDHQFGSLHIETWDQMKVEAEITIKASGNNTAKDQERIENIEIQMDASDAAIQFKTVFKKAMSKSDKDNLEISYRLKIPRNNSLYTTLAFGSFYLGDFDGYSNLELSYSQLKMGQLSGECDAKITFSNGNITGINSGFIELGYSDLDISKMGNIEIDSKFSNLEFESMGKVKLEDKYGNISIESVDHLDATVSFGSLEIGSIRSGIILQTKYANNVNVKKVSRQFKIIDIEGKFSNFTFEFLTGASGSIEAELSYGKLLYDESKFRFSERIKQDEKEYYKGTFGTSGGSSKVLVDTSYSDVKLNLN